MRVCLMIEGQEGVTWEQWRALAATAEEAGFEALFRSDHYASLGGGPNTGSLDAWSTINALAALTSRIKLGTLVSPGTFRHPSVLARMATTADHVSGGRVELGMGAGWHEGEHRAFGFPFPDQTTRLEQLAEQLEIVHRLWTEDTVDFAGEHYRTERATVYDRPERPVPIYVAASGPLAAKLAGRVGDGFICTSGKAPELYEELLGSVREGAEAAGRDADAIARMIEVKLSYDRDPELAERNCRPWAALSLTPEEKTGVEDPVEMERLADAHADRAGSRFIVSADPEVVVERVGTYVELGFTELIFHLPADEQERSLEQFAADVLPRLRERWPTAEAARA